MTAAPGAPFVSTVLGPVAPADLGVTLLHEHLTTDVARALGRNDAGIEHRRGVLMRAQDALSAVHACGVGTFVDVGTQQFGPSPLFLLAVAGTSPVHVVSAVGCFPLDMMPAPEWLYPPSRPEDVEERLLELAERGVHDSGVQPGIIKLGTGTSGITALEERMFRAAAAVHRRTGLGILTHSHETTLAEEQADLLAEEGVDLSRVVIGHIGWGTGRSDKDRHIALASRGVALGVDMIGLRERSDSELADIVADLVAEGLTDRVILSHDSTAASRGLAEIYGTRFFPGDPTVIHREFLPALQERGVPDDAVHQMLVRNPRRVLTIDPARYPDTRLGNTPATPESVVPFEGGR